ncbi:MAG: membrane protein insertase YidC [Candidatus Latescibacteria bacterium]|nr:membrane protein insertase YidC [bacterium]MBD3425424.1 membrane protein insertase YidC [Candidatus Latescibacterota bacterium]
MDKRSLMAIVLTFLVIVLWNFLYIKPKQEEARNAMLKKAEQDSVYTREDAGAEPAREESELVEEESFSGSMAPAREQKEHEPVEIKVFTRKMQLRLGSIGGEIKSVKLPEFKKNEDGVVELIPEGAEGGLGIGVLRSGEEEVDFGGNGFTVMVNGLEVSGDREIRLDSSGEQAEILFRREFAEGDYIEKRFLFFPDGYTYKFSLEMSRDSLLRGTESYYVKWDCGLMVTEEKEDWDRRDFASLGRVSEEFYKESLGSFGDAEPKRKQGTVTWAGARTKYFLSALMVDDPRSGDLVMLGDEEAGFVGFAISYPFRGDPRRVERHFTGYLGPLDMSRLEKFGMGLEDAVDLGWLRFFSVIILKIMVFLKQFIPNYGLIIIIMSIMTKLLFYRLTHKSFKSMKDMQKLQPKIKKLQEKYKDDKEKLNKETMKLYKEGGVNPLGGCLPLILQMPVFIALFQVLRNTIELRNAPFILWIDNLSAPDALFSFGASLPILGDTFNLLPLIMGGAMVLQSKLGGGGAAAPGGQQKMMQTMMPIVFTFIFYGMPSGLVLYWIVNNLLTITQQYIANREIEKEEREKAGENGTE